MSCYQLIGQQSMVASTSTRVHWTSDLCPQEVKGTYLAVKCGVFDVSHNGPSYDYFDLCGKKEKFGNKIFNKSHGFVDLCLVVGSTVQHEY